MWVTLQKSRFWLSNIDETIGPEGVELINLDEVRCTKHLYYCIPNSSVYNPPKLIWYTFGRVEQVWEERTSV